MMMMIIDAPLEKLLEHCVANQMVVGSNVLGVNSTEPKQFNSTTIITTITRYNLLGSNRCLHFIFRAIRH